MPEFFEYIRNITYYLVFMAAVGVIAPSGSYKKYISLIMGIMLIGIVVQPISVIFSRDSLPVTEIFGGINPSPVHNFEHSFHLTAMFHSQLTAQTEVMLARNGYQLIYAEWETSEDFSHINRVFLQVSALEPIPTPVPFIRVEPVRIAPYQPAEETEESHNVKKLLSDFYDLYIGNIHVEMV